MTRPRFTTILYRIKGDHKKQEDWGTAGFSQQNIDPGITINGADAIDYKVMINAQDPIEGEVIGTWLYNLGDSSKLTLYKKDGKTYMHTRYVNGESSDLAQTLTETDKGTKLTTEGYDENDPHNQYFVVSKEGDLELWNRRGYGPGLFYTAQKYQPE